MAKETAIRYRFRDYDQSALTTSLRHLREKRGVTRSVVNNDAYYFIRDMISNRKTKDHVSERVALGNTGITLRQMCIDLINDSNSSWDFIAQECFLAKVTVQNLASGKTQHPRADTVERILKFFNMEMSAYQIGYNPESMNMAKDDK
jgi:hypothetical protein